MRSAILAVGDELLLGDTLDTNSRWIAERLAALGAVPVEHRLVGDDRTAIARAIRELAQGRELLVVTGGLGPTADDLTREALGDVVAPGRPLIASAEAIRTLERWFAGRPMPEGNRRQTLAPEGSTLLENPNGTAPGIAAQSESCRIVLLPGPPREMRPMFESAVAPGCDAARGAEPVHVRLVHAFGLGESDAAQRLGALMDRGRDPLVGTTARDGIVTARLRTRGDELDALLRLDEVTARVNAAWRPFAFGADDQTLAGAVGRRLRAAGAWLATAESCTGGWLGKLLVDEPGSSGWYLGGYTTYANALKTTALGVPEATIGKEGAVSAATAAAMATGAIEATGGSVALATTGVAGPEGGCDEKPVGTVYIALGFRGPGDAGAVLSVRRFRFRGDRGAVRYRTCLAALQMLRLALLDAEGIGGAARGGTEHGLLWETSGDDGRSWRRS